MKLRTLLITCLLAACAATPRVIPPPDPTIPLVGFDLIVKRDTKVRPGTYFIGDGDGDGIIHVVAPGVTLDLTDVTIVGYKRHTIHAPDKLEGVCVRVEGAPGAKVIGGVIKGFKVGVQVRASDGAVIDGVRLEENFRQHLHSTVEREDLRDWLRPHDNDEGEWEAKYGAAVSVTDSEDVTVRNCRARTGQNGLLLTRSDGARVHDNDFSFLSGWGVALYRTSDTVVCRNRLDWCVRGYSHGRYDRGQDSAGILVFEQCSRNVFALNSATHGGDGFFLYAGEETLKRTGKGGCNDNIVWRNDFSHAVANGIEATFSTGNVFRENVIADCRHAVWAGYSRHSQVSGNQIRDCENGVSIEHGSENPILANEIVDCGVGVHLWWDEDADLAATEFGRAHDLLSRDNLVMRNRFSGNDVDVRLRGDRASAVTDNVPAAGSALQIEDDLPDGRTVERNDRTESAHVTWGTPPKDADDLPAPTIDVDPHAAPLRAAEFAGRRFILVDDWGPVNPAEVRLFPARVNAGGEARFSLVRAVTGSSAHLGEFRMTSLTAGFRVTPAYGSAPATLVVRREPGSPSGIHEFELEIRIAERETPLRAAGSLFTADWDVRFFRWSADPREDDAAWKELLAGEPLERRRGVPSLEYAWASKEVGPEVGKDRFGTLATTEFDLAKEGRYELRTLSDDGIRVWVDGKLVIDDWTHHGPTPHDAVLKLGKGRHSLRVEHFELDGWAVLHVTLVRL